MHGYEIVGLDLFKASTKNKRVTTQQTTELAARQRQQYY